jgi:protoporphyrinogen oxidase
MMTTRVDVAIVGGGIAGLCVADRLRRESPDVVVRVYEASDRAGGKLLTERIELDDGRFIVEAGPDAWLAQKPWASELVKELGLADQVIPINRLERPVAILKDGRPIDLPEGVSLIAPSKAWPFLRTPLLSPRGKLRMAADLLLRPRAGDMDESLGAFVERRLGREALNWIAEPIAAGIYNADPHQMSLLATFPQLRRLEQEHGSVIRGLRERRDVVAGLRTRLGVRIRSGSRWQVMGRPRRPELKVRAENGKPTEGAEEIVGFSRLQALARVFRPGHTDDRLGRIATIDRIARRLGEAFRVSPGFQSADGHGASTTNGAGRLPSTPTERPPTFLTLRDGMQTLVDALAERVGDAVETKAAVTGITSEPTVGYRLTITDRPDLLAEQVVLTTPATTAADLLVEVAPDLADRLRELRAVHAGTISLAYRTADIPRPLPGYGLAIPAKEGRPINAITVASRKFAGRAPAGWELLRVFFGGYRSPETMRLDDNALLEVVTAELRDLLGITAPPAFHRIHRWPAGSPQYDVGHLDRIAAIEATLPAGITLTGSPYRGVGIPDVIREARTQAGAEARSSREWIVNSG